MTFKVGDWVRSKSFENDGNKELLIKKLKVQQQVDFVNKYQEEWEFWKPQEGEWCWFYFSESVSDHNCLTLGKFIGFRNKESNALFLEYYDTDNNIFASDMCEPFIGNLPSFIKEIK